MWFRRRKDHEKIKQSDYCGKFHSSVVPNVFMASDCPGLKVVTNGVAIGMLVGAAREHFVGYEFFETSEEKLHQPQPLFEEFKFLNDGLFK